MKNLSVFILGFIVCLLPLCFMTIVELHDASNVEVPEPEIIFNEKINYSESEKIEEVVTFEQTNVFEKGNLSIEEDLHSILKSHHFSSWSNEEKTLLCYMMQMTARGEQISAVTFSKASDRILETYLDLLEHAGYK